MPFLCPHCQHSIQNISEECSECGAVFDPSQWPEEAYSLTGMRPKIRFTWSNSNTWEPNTNEFVIAREPGINGLELKGKLVSSTRARVFCKETEWHLLRENKQIKVNGVDIDEIVLKSGDKIEFGPYVLNVSIDYVPTTIEQQELLGQLCSSSTEKLDNSHLYIGNDPALCRIVIDEANPKHALIYYRKEDDSWWLADCASSTGVKVNNERIRNARLYPSDKITIAGVELLFTGTELTSQGAIQEGLEISVNGISAKAKNGTVILNEMSFHISPGEFVGILGPSACGKTSVIQRIVGLADFSSGNMIVNGKPVKEIQEAYHAAMAYLPQQNTLHNDLTVKEEFSCFRSLHNVNGKNITYNSINQILRLLGLENELNKQISSLSGGQMRRAGIALALLRDPRLLVLDEPTSGLDPATETEVMTYLRRISNQGKTVICSTHILENIDLFDKILVISRGYLVFWGTPSELLEYFKISHPHSLYKIFAIGNTERQKETAFKFARKYFNSSFSSKYSSFWKSTGNITIKNKPSKIKQIIGYWKRMFYELFSFRHSKSKIKAFLLESPCFFQLFLQPLLVALTLKIACAYNLSSSTGRKEVLFFAASTVFWLGMNSSVRELVKERVPWRCLERLERIPASLYLFSKISWMIGLCLVQTIVFSLFLFNFQIGESVCHLLPNFQIVTPSTNDTSSVLFKTGIFITLFLICVTGSLIGLCISSIFSKENTAIAWLPIVLIPIMFFSQPIIRNDDNYGDITKSGNGHYTKLAIAIESIMPCNAAECVMDQLNTEINNSDARANIEHAWCIMLRNTALYMFFALMTMMWFQNHNEAKWDGR